MCFKRRKCVELKKKLLSTQQEALCKSSSPTDLHYQEYIVREHNRRKSRSISPMLVGIFVAPRGFQRRKTVLLFSRIHTEKSKSKSRRTGCTKRTE